jgi:hypothetical protein
MTASLSESKRFCQETDGLSFENILTTIKFQCLSIYYF